MAIAGTLGVISLGNTSGPEMRDALGVGSVNTGSWSYTAGEVVGVVGTLGLAEVGKVMSSTSEAGVASGTTHSVGSPGVTIPGNPAGARAALEEAGYKGTPSTKTSEAGTIHTLPGKDGKMNVRVMDGSNAHPPRAVTTRAGTNDPVRADGSKFKNNESKQERRSCSHIKLDDPC
jgi:ABC-type transport system substrate-binding protein